MILFLAYYNLVLSVGAIIGYFYTLKLNSMNNVETDSSFHFAMFAYILPVILLSFSVVF